MPTVTQIIEQELNYMVNYWHISLQRLCIFYKTNAFNCLFSQNNYFSILYEVHKMQECYFTFHLM